MTVFYWKPREGLKNSQRSISPKFSLWSRILKKLRHGKQTQAPNTEHLIMWALRKRPEAEGSLISTEDATTQTCLNCTHTLWFLLSDGHTRHSENWFMLKSLCGEIKSASDLFTQTASRLKSECLVMSGSSPRLVRVAVLRISDGGQREFYVIAIKKLIKIENVF